MKRTRARNECLIISGKSVAHTHIACVYLDFRRRIRFGSYALIHTIRYHIYCTHYLCIIFRALLLCFATHFLICSDRVCEYSLLLLASTLRLFALMSKRNLSIGQLFALPHHPAVPCFSSNSPFFTVY